MSRVRQYFESITSQLKTMRLDFDVNEVKGLLLRQLPLRHKTMREVSAEVIAQMIEKGFTKPAASSADAAAGGRSKSKRGRGSDETDSSSDSSSGDKKRAAGQDQDGNRRKRPPPLPKRRAKGITRPWNLYTSSVMSPSRDDSSDDLASSSGDSNETEDNSTMYAQSTNRHGKSLSYLDALKRGLVGRLRRPPTPPDKRSKDINTAFELMETRPGTNWEANFYDALQIPKTKEMVSRLSSIVDAMHDRNGGNALSATERKKLGRTLCEYFISTRRLSAESRSTLANKAKAIAVEHGLKYFDRTDSVSAPATPKLVGSLYESATALANSWRDMYVVVAEAERAGAAAVAAQESAAIRREHEKCVNMLKEGMTAQRKMKADALKTIRKIQLQIRAIDAGIDRMVAQRTDATNGGGSDDGNGSDRGGGGKKSKKKEAPGGIAVGTVVLAPFKQKSAFYRGHVESINVDGTLNIKYDDGDYEPSMPVDRVHVEGMQPIHAKPRTTASVMDLLDRAGEDKRIDESLETRKNLSRKLRHQNACIEHAQHTLRVLESMGTLALMWTKQREHLAVDTIRQLKAQMLDTERLFGNAAVVLRQKLASLSTLLAQRIALIADDASTYRSALERHDRLYGDSAPSSREKHEQCLEEVLRVSRDCEKGLDTVRAAVEGFACACSNGKDVVSFPQSAANAYFTEFTALVSTLANMSKQLETISPSSHAKLLAVVGSASVVVKAAEALTSRGRTRRSRRRSSPSPSPKASATGRATRRSPRGGGEGASSVASQKKKPASGGDDSMRVDDDEVDGDIADIAKIESRPKYDAAGSEKNIESRPTFRRNFDQKVEEEEEEEGGCVVM